MVAIRQGLRVLGYRIARIRRTLYRIAAHQFAGDEGEGVRAHASRHPRPWAGAKNHILLLRE